MVVDFGAEPATGAHAASAAAPNAGGGASEYKVTRLTSKQYQELCLICLRRVVKQQIVVSSAAEEVLHLCFFIPYFLVLTSMAQTYFYLLIRLIEWNLFESHDESWNLLRTHHKAIEVRTKSSQLCLCCLLTAHAL